MNIKTIFSEAIRQAYALSDFTLQSIIEEEWRQLYRIDCYNASDWVLRAYSLSNSDTRQKQYVKVLKLLEKHVAQFNKTQP